MQAALLTGNTSLLPQPAASQLAVNPSVVGQGAAQDAGVTAMEEDDDDDVTQAGEGEEEEGEEVNQSRPLAAALGSSITVQQATPAHGGRTTGGLK
jgi:hypothetical protein